MTAQIKRHPVSLASGEFSSDIHPLLQKIYLARGAQNDNDIATDMVGLLAPEQLKGLARAVSIIADHLQRGDKILVVGDFDADGATSSALAVSALRAMGARDADFLVPNRFEFGYGLTPEIVEVAAALKPQLIVTVDNGISSIGGVSAASSKGIEVVITDHHLPAAELPAAAEIVNPNQPGCQFASKNLAGVGVIFYVMSALRAELRSRGWFQQQSLTEPKMADYLDLVALGTVADVVSLDRNNRILVEQGLRRIRAGRVRPGIAALLEVAGRKQQSLVSADLGFALGPRLNAAGRLDDMSLGIQCLLSEDDSSAREMAAAMDELNHDRKAIEGSMQREALKSLDALSLQEGRDLPFGLCLFDADWHQGVIGILASRIKDRYHRPVIVFAEADDGINIKGSARSVKGFHIRDALDAVAARHPGLLKKFGGHAMAAGMSLAKEDFGHFSKAFDREVQRHLQADDLQAVYISDGELTAEQLNLDFARLLRAAGPWGQSFQEPLFDGVFFLLQQRIVGHKHLKMLVATDAQGQQSFDAIAFNIDVSLWPDKAVSQVRLAYKLDVNEFRNRETAQLLVEYLEKLP